MQVLMISLSDGVLDRWGDTQERHLDYAARIDHLHMIVYSPRSRGREVTRLGDRLTVYPTRSVVKPAFITDGVRIGLRVARDHPLDVITTQGPHTSGLIGVWLKRRLGLPLDVQNHSDFFDNADWISEKPLRYGLFNRLGKWVITQADTHRVLNEVEKQKYVAMGIDPERITVLATPVRLGRFQPGGGHQARQALNLPPGAPVLLWVGKPGPVKRVPVLVEAFAIVRQTHPEAHLVLVGDFEKHQPEVITQVERAGLAEFVRMPGRIEHEDLPAYYQMCSIYVHASSYEGLGKVLIEAASCGKPVVSTCTAGAQAIVKDGETGLLTHIDDPQDLAEKVITLLGDPQRAQRMGEAARAYVSEKYDHARNLDAVIATWQRTIEVAR